MNRLQHLLHGVQVVTSPSFDAPVEFITSDSRRIWPGSVFVAIPGSGENGTNYIRDAIQKGAAAIITEEEKTVEDSPSIATPLVTVQDIRRAYSMIAANYYGHPSKHLTVIGVTGTNGKTSFTFLMRSILSEMGLKTGIIGTLGAYAPGMEAQLHLTTPDAMELHRILRLFLDSGVTHVAMEVSSHALTQHRATDVDFDVAVFTNLTQDHLDYHKTMDEYFNAKATLFQNLPSDAKAILNSSDERFKSLRRLTKGNVLTYSPSGKTGIHYKKSSITQMGIEATIDLDGNPISIKSKLIGSHNLENILAAVTTAVALGIPAKVIERGIAKCEFIPGRMERYETKKGALVVLDYAHTPDAYHKLFQSLQSLLPKNGKLYVLFGCGGDRDPLKRPLMASAAETYAEWSYITPDNPRTENLEKINDDIRKGFRTNHHTFHESRAHAISDAIKKLKRGDVLAVVGKGRENYQIIGTEKILYSDLDEIQKMIHEN